MCNMHHKAHKKDKVTGKPQNDFTLYGCQHCKTQHTDQEHKTSISFKLLRLQQHRWKLNSVQGKKTHLRPKAGVPCRSNPGIGVRNSNKTSNGTVHLDWMTPNWRRYKFFLSCLFWSLVVCHQSTLSFVSSKRIMELYEQRFFKIEIEYHCWEFL